MVGDIEMLYSYDFNFIDFGDTVTNTLLTAGCVTLIFLAVKADQILISEKTGFRDRDH
ncbi:hypothetical protein Sbal117_2437 [Shewanella baltica OS117]|nr:hypothetical protein Sbal117_2437 [Shewanella baltica OS117]